MSTSKPFGNNNVPSTSVLFEDRKIYYDTFVKNFENQEYFDRGSPLGDLYLNNSLYGLVDLNGDLIELKNPKRDLVLITGFNNKQFKLLNFVADAYSGLRNYMNKAILTGKISLDNPLSNLLIHRAYINLFSYVTGTRSYQINLFKNKYTSSNELNSKIKNHKDFIHEFNMHCKSASIKFPITKSASLLSSNFFGFTSGMIFDIADVEADDDLKKYEKFLNTNEFIIFSEACMRFGFKIDKNVPWRLIADLNSPAMRPYLTKYKLNNINDIFKYYFNKVYLSEIDDLKNFYYAAYNFFLEDNENYNESYKNICNLNSDKQTVFKREAATPEKFFKDYEDGYWLKVYALLKNYEFKKGLTQIEFDNIVREGTDFTRINKNDRALKYINDFFKDFNLVYYYGSQKYVPEEQQDDIKNYSFPDIYI